MPSRQSYLRPGGTVGEQLIGHQDVSAKPCFLSSLRLSFTAASFPRRFCTSRSRTSPSSSTGPPQPELAARNHHGHLVEMPPRCWSMTSAAKFSSEQRPEFQNPPPHGLVGYTSRPRSASRSSTLRKRAESNIEPHRVPLITGGNWWRANEVVVIRHLTSQTRTRHHSYDNARDILGLLVPAITASHMLICAGSDATRHVRMLDNTLLGPPIVGPRRPIDNQTAIRHKCYWSTPSVRAVAFVDGDEEQRTWIYRSGVQ